MAFAFENYTDMATTVAKSYAKKIFSYVPAREKRFLKQQAAFAKKYDHKLTNLLQAELSHAKAAVEGVEAEAKNRIVVLKENALGKALLVSQTLGQWLEAFEKFDEPVTLEPVPHHNNSVIPGMMKTASAKASAPKVKRARTSAAAQARNSHIKH